MKWLENNLFLSVLIVVLLTGLYWQKNSTQLFLEAPNSLHSFLPKTLERLEYEGNVVKKEKDHFLYSDTQIIIPGKNIETYLESLKAISIENPVSDFPENQERDFDIVFNNKRIIFYKPNPLTGNFHIALSQGDQIKYLLASSDREYEGLYKDEADLKFKSYKISKRGLTDWSQNILRIKVFNANFNSFSRDLGGDKKIVFDFAQFVTEPAAPAVLGYKKEAFEQFHKDINNLVPVNILRELPRETKKWGNIEFDEMSFELHSLDGIYYLKKQNVFWQLSEAATNVILHPVTKLWGEQFSWLSEVFDDLSDFTFNFGKTDLAVHVNEKSELIFKAKNLNKKHIQGIKEVLCYVSQCRKEYQVLRINSKSTTENYPYQIQFKNHKIQFKIEGPVLKLFDPESKIELEYLWSLFRDGDLFQELRGL